MAPEWFVVAMILLIVLFTVASSAWASSMSGWSRLARTYQAMVHSDGERFRFASASWRRQMDYNLCLTMTVNAEGLHLAIMPFLLAYCVGHPPLFLPWAEMSLTRERTTWCGEHLCIRMARDPDVPIRLRLKLADKLHQAAERAWPERTADAMKSA